MGGRMMTATGWAVGAKVGLSSGARVGESVGAGLGRRVGGLDVMGERVGVALGNRDGALTGDCIGEVGFRVGRGIGKMVATGTARVGDTVDESLVGSKMRTGVVTGAADEGASGGANDGDAGAVAVHGARDAVVVGVVWNAGGPTEGTSVNGITVGTTATTGPIPDGAGEGARVKVAFHNSGEVVGATVVADVPGNVWLLE
jgi:hypothetical protein